ncbi:sulfotransferase family protein [Nocardioides bizhenqiangii]|uniref:Sulfotransferase n=1 Tax=Nocardioides bizhenqiangii TaxID=3095076 RepID=A0ABZ0ZN35_9ACTN|nr:sulfotransferase [Nocardioides sp. HM61]WQQ25638.1 sulfotransferase [Nocardioides sp. HM61]
MSDSPGHGPPRIAFVIGTGRCGSTLVHEILARHPDNGFVTNLDDKGIRTSSRIQNQAWRRLPAAVTTKGRFRFAPSEAYRVLAREVSPALVDPVRDLLAADATPWLTGRMQAFVGRRTARLRSEVFLHKFTGWPRTGFLQACFPGCAVIEIVRDPRAVANSWLQMPWWHGHRGPGEWHFGPLAPEQQAAWEGHGRSFPVLAALAWQMLTDASDRARSEVPADRWLTVRYEDIVADPRTSLSSLLTHLGLEWTPDFETGFNRYSIQAARTDAFRRDLAPADLAAIEDVLSGSRAFTELYA